MANLRESLKYVIGGYNSSIEYCGIQRKFFPKWEGWKDIDNDCNPPIETVIDFYNVYFWAKLKGDHIHNQDLADLLFVFAVRNGKKKLVDKLDRVLGTNSQGLMTNGLIERLNTSDVYGLFLHIYAELTEFCIMMNKKDDFIELLKIYNSFIQS